MPMLEREHLLVKDFPVQFLAASGLTEKAVRKAKQICPSKKRFSFLEIKPMRALIYPTPIPSCAWLSTPDQGLSLLE